MYGEYGRMVNFERGMFFVIVDDTNVAKIMKVVPADENPSFLTPSLPVNSDVILTQRERDVLKLIIEGKSNTEIASDLIISVHTAKAHVCSILQKLCVTDRVQAAVKAVRERLV